MNERIQSIAEHCDFYVGNEHYDKSHQEKQRLWTEKFAELIVRECMALCKSMDETDTRCRYDYRRGVLDCVDTIKEHFGVEQ